MLLASCSYEESKKFNSRIVLVSEDVTNKKPEEVRLNIVTDNPNEVFIGGIGVAECMTTRVSPNFCPTVLQGNVFRLYDYGEDLVGVNSEIEGVVPMLVLPDGYSDMRELSSIVLKYPNLRVTGGNILEIPGIKIGRYDKGKEKMTSVFCGVYDIFKEVDLQDIKVQRIMSKVRTKSQKSGSSPQKQGVSKSRKTETFSKFFGSGGDEF